LLSPNANYTIDLKHAFSGINPQNPGNTVWTDVRLEADGFISRYGTLDGHKSYLVLSHEGNDLRGHSYMGVDLAPSRPDWPVHGGYNFMQNKFNFIVSDDCVFGSTSIWFNRFSTFWHRWGGHSFPRTVWNITQVDGGFHYSNHSYSVTIIGNEMEIYSTSTIGGTLMYPHPVRITLGNASISTTQEQLEQLHVLG